MSWHILASNAVACASLFQGISYYKKECALAHSRAERGRLRHVSASRECASSRSVFCFIGRNFLLHKKTLPPRFITSETGFSLLAGTGLRSTGWSKSVQPALSHIFIREKHTKLYCYMLRRFLFLILISCS